MRLSVLVCVTMFILGCGGSSVPQLGSVSGTVTKGDQPVSGVKVTFAPKEEGRPSSGLTDDQGKFDLMYNVDEKGAVIGMHTITLAPVDDEENYEDGDEDGEGNEDKAITDYRSEVEVKSGDNTFELDI